jgi:hypothetical protein
METDDVKEEAGADHGIKDDAGADPGGGGAASFPSGLRVMVVDDDPLCLKVVEQMLKRCSYNVHTCNNAASALELLRAKRHGFDLVLSDVYMPGARRRGGGGGARRQCPRVVLACAAPAHACCRCIDAAGHRQPQRRRRPGWRWSLRSSYGAAQPRQNCAQGRSHCPVHARPSQTWMASSFWKQWAWNWTCQ